MTAWVPSPAPGTGAAYVERGLVTFAVLWQAAWTLTDVLPRTVQVGSPVLALEGMAALAWIAVVATLWGPSSWRRFRARALSVDLAVLTVAAVGLSAVAPGAQEWPLGIIATVRAAVFGVLVLWPAPGFVLAASTALVSGVILWWRPGGLNAVDATLETLYPLALATGALVLARALRRAGSAMDAAYRQLADEDRRRIVQESVARATADHERQIHDQVLNTLAAVARGTTADPARLRSRCGEAAQALRMLALSAPATRVESSTIFEEAVDALGSDWHVEVDIAGEAFADVPPDVVAAFATASAEAVRNAGRHSGGDHLVITAERQPDRLTISVEDNGRGPEGWGPARLGITRSMRQAMAEQSGTVEWVRGDGGGTRVVLTAEWPMARAGAISGLEPDAASVLQRIGAPFLLTFLSYGAVVVVAGWRFYPAPQWAALWLAVAIVAAPAVGAVPAVARRFGLTGGPTWTVRSWLGIAVALAAAFCVVRLETWAVGGAAMPVWVTWSSEVAVALLFSAILIGPPWTVAPALIAWVLAQDGGLLELLQPGSIMLMIGAVFAVSMRRRARDLAVTSAAISAEQARAAAAQRDLQQRRERFAVLGTYAEPLLQDICDGRVDVTDPEVAERCLLEERVARSVVRVDCNAGPVESLLHEAVVIARARDLYVDADLVGDTIPMAGGADLEVLRSDMLAVIAAWEQPGAQARLTGGWEDGRPVFRLLAQWEGDEDLWEWGMADVER